MIGYYLRHGLKRIYRHRQLAFFAWDVNETGPGELDPEIRKLDIGPDFNQVGPRVLPPFLWRDGHTIMMHRLRRRTARIYLLEKENVTVGYCFTQEWCLFERSMGWLGPSYPMLGPGWTDPAYRGHGFFGRMMNHAIYVENEMGHSRMYGFALVSNHPSRKGIERTGAICLGCHDIREYFLGLVTRHKPLEQFPARIDRRTEN